MKTEQLQELDAWIAEHVMGWVKSKECDYGWITPVGKMKLETENYTTDPAAAMEVLRKCAFKRDLIISCTASEWIISDDLPETEIQDFVTNRVEAGTLELAICLFSKKLFSK